MSMATKGVCEIADCNKPKKARGWCAAHWWRWRNHGDPLGAAYAPTPCSVGGCEEVAISRGWCSRHYQRFRKWGTPTGGYPSPGSLTDAERFSKSVDKSADCWIWTAGKSVKGYGQFAVKGRDMPAHRYSYELHIGPIPDGMQIDHRCRVKACVNPAHLRVVTNKQNCEHKGLSAANTSGYRGVQKHASGKWVVNVGHNGVRYYGGIYATPEEANFAAIALRNRLYTHNDLDRSAA